MSKQSFQNVPLCIILCFCLWSILVWVAVPNMFPLAGGDYQLKNVISLTALRMQLQQLSIYDGEEASREDHTASRPGFQDNLRGRIKDCNGRYVYMYDLPPEFNLELISKCDRLSRWTNMCPHIANSGLGQPLDFDPESSSWFATNQFTAEVIFHERMKRYPCLTPDPHKASVFYVPFYAGFEMSSRVREHNFMVRDRAGVDLVRFLRKQSQWKKNSGRDHFMMIGRITWDFLREADTRGAWGNRLLLLPEVKNMVSLLIEAHPWHANEYGIPYPSYFHPWEKSELQRWQNRMRSQRRDILYSFAGAPRPGLEKASIRANIVQQCSASHRCRMLKCEQGPSVCHEAGRVMELFSRSVFCLQPQGDSFTRRSIFDSMLAGCIPVFFTEHSAYTQYKWHLPRNPTSYSVLIGEESILARNVSIEEHLLSVKENDIHAMRSKVVDLIPSLLFADPRRPNVEFRDAFDVAIDSVIKQIKDQNRRLPTFSKEAPWQSA